MKSCNCKVEYYLNPIEFYSLNIDLTGTSYNEIEMVWDTGASKTIIYHNFIKGLKGTGQ